ncbi:MAG: hypothetical protein ACO3TP_02305 [Ilumatobacteraceae bacterium]
MAFSTPDLDESTLTSWRRRLGTGPFVIVRHVELDSCLVHGQPADFDHSSAFAQWGEMMIELIVEHSRPRVGPVDGIHHVAFIVPSIDDAAENCSELGWPIALSATTKRGQRFMMFDARHDLGHLVEVYEATSELVGFYQYVRRLRDDEINS